MQTCRAMISKRPPGHIVGVERVHGIAQGQDVVKAPGRDQPHRIEAQALEMVLRCLNGLHQRLHEFLATL
jgi:hypothetical protein